MRPLLRRERVPHDQRGHVPRRQEGHPLLAVQAERKLAGPAGLERVHSARESPTGRLGLRRQHKAECHLRAAHDHRRRRPRGRRDTQRMHQPRLGPHLQPGFWLAQPTLVVKSQPGEGGTGQACAVVPGAGGGGRVCRLQEHPRPQIKILLGLVCSVNGVSVGGYDVVQRLQRKHQARQQRRGEGGGEGGEQRKPGAHQGQEGQEGAAGHRLAPASQDVDETVKQHPRAEQQRGEGRLIGGAAPGGGAQQAPVGGAREGEERGGATQAAGVGLLLERAGWGAAGQ
eukprot:scaffold3456_cov101-Isochrysis_galbana.AAC.2